jgi:hypothetical protein
VYYQPPPQPAYYGPRYSGCLKFFLYVVSLLIPVVGIVVGLIYTSRPDLESKRLGQACLVLGIVSLVVSCCVAIILGLSPMLFLPFIEQYG